MKSSSDLSGWKKLLKRLETLDKTGFEVGFFEEDQYDSDNDFLPVAQVATWQEYGTPSNPNPIPPRPFMRVGLVADMKDRSFRTSTIKAIHKIISAKSNANVEMRKLGAQAAELLKDNIAVWSSPANSPSTIEQKGFNDPLIETDKMFDSAKYKLKKKVT